MMMDFIFVLAVSNWGWTRLPAGVSALHRAALRLKCKGFTLCCSLRLLRWAFLPDCRERSRTYKVNNRHAPTIALGDLGFAVFLWYFSPNCPCCSFPRHSERQSLRVTISYGTRFWFQQSKGSGPGGEIRPAGQAAKRYFRVRKSHQGRPERPHSPQYHWRSLCSRRQ